MCEKEKEGFCVTMFSEDQEECFGGKVSDKGRIVSFDLAKINRGKERICSCKVPHYEIDTVNRLVMCMDCGAVVDAFDALLSLTEKFEEVEKRQREMLERARRYREFADEERDRMIRNRVFREMSLHYKKGLLPVCPECGEVFDPVRISRWTREVIKEEEKEK